MAVQNAYDESLNPRKAKHIRARPLEAAIKAAQTRNERNSDYRLGACIAKANRIISVGYNRQKTHTKSRHKYKWLHAEMDAILRAREDLRGATIYVVRVRKNDTLGRSMPCRECMSWLAEVGIKKIIFCDQDGGLLELRPTS